MRYLKRIFQPIFALSQQFVVKFKKGIEICRHHTLELSDKVKNQFVRLRHRVRIVGSIRVRQIMPMFLRFVQIVAVGALTGLCALAFYALHIFSDPVDSCLKSRAFTRVGEESSLFSTFFVTLGAAVVGVISVSFALSLFSIQQAADRHTPKILEEFRNDRLSRFIYWALAGIAMLLFIFALCPFSHFLKYELAAATFLIPAAFVLLRLQYLHIIDLVNPRSLIRIELDRALRDLDQIDQHANSLIAGGFIQPPPEGHQP